MAISFVNSSTAGGAFGTSLSISNPAGIATGDVMLMLIYLELTGQDVSVSGWTRIGSRVEQLGGTDYQMVVFYKVHDGSAGPYSITWDGTNHWRDAEIVAYSGVSTSAPINASAMAASVSSTTTMRGPSVTTTVDNCVLVMLGTNDAGSGITPPSGMTERVDVFEIYAADVIQSTAGSTGNKDATLPAAHWNAGALIALAPAVATIPLNAASGIASATLALSAKTAAPLNASSGVASATLALSAKTAIPINASSGISSPTLALSAQTAIPLGASSGVASPTLALSAKTTIPLNAASGSSSATLALTASRTENIRVKTAPPLRESWKLTTPSGRVYRWAEDEPKAENVPLDATYSSSMPGGYKDCSVTLPRKPEHDYSDLERGSTLEAFTCGKKVGEYRVDRVPRASGDQIAVTVQGVGWINHLEDDKSASEIFVDRDLSGWSAMSATERIRQLNLTRTCFDPSTEPDISSGLPTLKLEWDDAAPAGGAVCSAWYDAGSGLTGAKVYYDLVIPASSSGYAIYSDPSQHLTLYTGDDDHGGGEVDVSGNLRAASGSGLISGFTPKRFLRWEWLYAKAGGSSGEQFLAKLRDIAVIGNHGLTLYGSAPSCGVLASDVIPYAISKWAPLLKYTTGSTGTIRPSSFVITNLAQKDRGTAGDIMRAADRYELSDYAVWNDKTFYYAARGTFARQWRARVREAKLQETGPQMDRVWNGILVRFTDVDGSTRIVGPTGSNCTTTSDSLLDTDPLNPANQLGIRKWDMLDMQGVALFTDAIRVGQRFLEESKALDGSGQATITGYVMDSGGRIFPHTHMRAGDEISFVDASDSSYRRIVNVQHQRSTRSSQIDLDAPPDSHEQLLARLNVVLVRMGMGS